MRRRTADFLQGKFPPLVLSILLIFVKSCGEHDPKTKKKRGRQQVDVLSKYKAAERAPMNYDWKSKMNKIDTFISHKYSHGNSL